MDTPLAVALWIAPQIPALAYTFASHSFGFSPTSSKWDLRTEITVHVLRQFMSGKGRKPIQITKAQARINKDPGIKGKMWVAKATMRKPASNEENIEAAVIKAIEDMKSDEVQLTKPGLVDIEVEWTGNRPNAGNSEALPNISEEEKYQQLMAEPSRTSEVTILYLHGGAYYVCDPATHRPITSLLARESKGRVCSVRYRLAPQTAFPGQLIDALMVYLSLLHPPPGSLHEPVPAKNIVFAGDSAGGNLSMALLQLLLQLHRSSPNSPPTLLFHGREVPVPLPGGASAMSGWFDITRSLPSVLRNAGTDYLPAPRPNESISRYLPDEAWPTNPPRGDLFCDLSCIDHPLASLVLAESWEGAPPLWLSVGDEQITDEDCIVAAKAARQGVKVEFEHYEAMPHVFAGTLPHLATSKSCLRSWADWARRCVDEPEGMRTKGTLIRAKSGKEEEIDVEKVAVTSEEEAKKCLAEAKVKRLQGFEEVKVTLKSSL